MAFYRCQGGEEGTIGIPVPPGKMFQATGLQSQTKGLQDFATSGTLSKSSVLIFNASDLAGKKINFTCRGNKMILIYSTIHSPYTQGYVSTTVNMPSNVGQTPSYTPSAYLTNKTTNFLMIHAIPYYGDSDTGGYFDWSIVNA